MVKRYNLQDGAILCAAIHPPLKARGLFVGLTGGCCYKPGARKDIDLVLYRHRQDGPHPDVAIDEFVAAVSTVAKVENVQEFGFVTKMEIDGMPVDVLFPEAGDDGSYGIEE